MYFNDDFLQLSALQHFLFCQRQCALIHIEQVWEENLFTAEGRVMHEKAHEEQFETKGGVRIERGMPLRSEKLGLNGKADIVEFHRSENGKKLEPFPVEYKRGKPKENNCDKVQLCAQSICLEEMLGCSISNGAIFYGKTHRRLDVEFTEELRKETIEAAAKVHELIKEGETPKALYSRRCGMCSIISVCMPKAMERKKSVTDYLMQSIGVEDGEK